MNVENFYKRLETPEGRKYLEFIQNSKHEEGKYTELHHIFPRALGGTDDSTNLVRLTSYQHVLAHIYLAKAIPCKQTLLALTWMSRKNVQSLSELEKIELGQIREWAELREQASKECSKLIHNPEALSKSLKTSQQTREKKYGSCTAYLHIPEVNQKRGETIAKRYGGDVAGQLHTSEAFEKMYQTKLERYGTRGPVVSEESRKRALEKSKQTNLQRYGKLGRAENFRDPEVHRRAVENSRITRTAIYGSATGAMNTPEARQKANDSRRKAYSLRREYMQTQEFKDWWEKNKDNYRSQWVASGPYVRNIIHANR